MTLDFICDQDGNVVGEWNGTAWTNNTTYFVHPDHLGSTRLMTGVNQSVCDSMDFMPFGEQILGGSCTTHKFTGQERDSESNLDNFQARYVSSQQGRFMSPDLAGVLSRNPFDPQQLNLYSYVRNNPPNFIDLTGLDCVYFNDAGDAAEYIAHNSNDTECAQNNGTWVNGYATNSGVSYNAGTDMFTIQSWDDDADSVTNYTTTASAPGSQTSGNDCYEDCIYSYNQSTVNFSSWGGAFFGNLFSWESFGAAQIHAQDTGYYGCIPHEMLPFKGAAAALAAKGVEEGATHAMQHGGATLAARVYYGLTDARFTAWGASSKVLVPRAAATIAKVSRGLSLAGWAATEAEAAVAINACSAKVNGGKKLVF